MLAKPHMSWHLSREYTGEGFRSECLFHYAEQLPLLLTYSTKPKKGEVRSHFF